MKTLKPSKVYIAMMYAQHIVDYDETIRSTAEYFNAAPSTVHYYIHTYLKESTLLEDKRYVGNGYLYTRVLKVFDAHISRVRSQLPIAKKRAHNQEAE